MSLQLVRDGIGSKAACVLLAVWMMAAVAGAQVATRTQVSVASAGNGATLTATVADVAGNPAKGGTVSFETAQGSVGSAFVENGIAKLTVDKLPKGTRSVTAAYSGSGGLGASSAAAGASPEASSGTLPDFALTASPTSLSLTPGQSGNVTVTVTPENGFNDMVSLSCAGLPAQAACIFSPTTLTPLTASAISSTLQITTQGASGTQALVGRPGSTVAFALVIPGMLALMGLPGLRRRSGISRMAGFVVLLTLALGISGCGSRYGYLNHPPSGNPGVYAGTYTIVVSGYAALNGTSVVGHSLNVTLTVK